MQTATQIYGQTIRQMSAAERLHLATLILESLTAEDHHEQNSEIVEPPRPLSARQLLERRRAEDSIFKTSAEADEYLKAERESWDK